MGFAPVARPAVGSKRVGDVKTEPVERAPENESAGADEQAANDRAVFAGARLEVTIEETADVASLLEQIRALSGVVEVRRVEQNSDDAAY